MNGSCASCCFRSGGECRRFPPQAHEGQDGIGYSFPDVELDAVCGEYQRASAPDAPASLRRSTGWLADTSSHVKALA